jgi:hypothetical protein
VMQLHGCHQGRQVLLEAYAWLQLQRGLRHRNAV